MRLQAFTKSDISANGRKIITALALFPKDISDGY
jgi:hypothetical protein